MCGIFVYRGSRNGIRIALDGLKAMEYRGYDSAGIGYILDGKLQCCKAVGKLGALQEKMGENSAHTVIAHTRWATHGGVTHENAHPLTDESGNIAVVLNGIIENYQQLREELKREGIKFRSETDTEVIPHLVAKLYQGDLLHAVQEAVSLLKGSWAFAILHRDHPDEVIVARHHCPLIIGSGIGEMFVASDHNALIQHTREVIYLNEGDIARLTADTVEVFDAERVPVTSEVQELLHSAEELSKGEFEHYTLKEIYEQPQAIRNAMLSRFYEDYGTVALDDLHMNSAELLDVKRILIVACGTSLHAGLIASYMLEEMARIPTSVEISSEFRYKNPIVEEGTLVIAISQSGETADTLAAVRELRAKGATIVAICNVQGSALTREADETLFLRAGPEIGVCSTKAFTSQLTILALFALMMGRLRAMSKKEGQEFLTALKALPKQVETILSTAPMIEKIARKYAKSTDFFYIGRRYMFPTCLEGALKLKEIAYINASGYAAGEMKHGPIALLNEQCPTFALCADIGTYDKIVSNVMEAKARHSPVICLAFEGDRGVSEIADDLITIPKTLEALAPILATVACQLFAYYAAKERGADIDQPRNLAKSVTVE